jgi:hypothetical protein
LSDHFNCLPQNGDHKMKLKLLLTIATFACTNAYGYLSPSADKVLLQTTCGTTVNCTSNINEIIHWVNVDRVDLNKHIIVDIGPGTYSIQSNSLFCENSNNISYRGAGRDITIITGGRGSTLAGGPYVLDLFNCKNVNVQDLTVRSDSRGTAFSTGSYSGIKVDAGTTSNWTNVNIQATITGWYNIGGIHNWYGSKIDVNTLYATNLAAVWGIYVQGGENWFFGGEISIQHTSQNEVISIIGVGVNGGQNQIFGSLLRITLDNNSRPANPFSPYGVGALLSYNGGAAHMHGGIISVKSAINQDVFCVSSGGPAFTTTASMVHTPDTAFSISSLGNAYRIKSYTSTTPMSPFLWQNGDTLPNIISTNGSDQFVETDCNNTGNCEPGTVGSKHPHLMIYDDTCAAFGSRWFDSTRGKCRGEP